MDRLLFLLATGLARGAVFALFALSLVLIWRAARIINFAQGAMALVATYVAFAVTGITGSYWAGLAAGVIAGAAIGFGVERGVMRFAPHSSPLAGVIIAIGLVMVLQSVLGILFGQQYRPMAAPFDDSPLVVGGVPLLSPYDIFVLVVATVVMTGLALLFRFTSLGLQLRASAFAPEVSRILGVRVSRMVTIGWMLSAAVAALAALLLVPTELGLNPHSTDVLFVYAFTVAVVGGLDSPVGALLGGLVVGVAMTLVTGYLGATVAPIGVLVLLVGVLLVRPGGIFSMREARSA
ncbi:branched-chain amino acid transport system permease protein [Microbacterium terrae]|uniref:High-affinity branched-chain amino acid transport system permease protein LivH n=1 Tax=Microbacterium terrae TaxID=69369 RepID=A0A0M2HJW3_9MICO|nr:branched-chain amino acid ABC transporter permease [Microbacterium terrae]KJL45120.1 High-affinity branched-chain amino acid transport system permease protein LivH [Microbacterium terrae]MBP1078158.1 branched-chain amino acid transport system permease protein [Microbacterium terrae]GLJ97638.1 branched-chain amino acid ABC transporter permease [Microbacterium terrae]